MARLTNTGAVLEGINVASQAAKDIGEAASSVIGGSQSTQFLNAAGVSAPQFIIETLGDYGSAALGKSQDIINNIPGVQQFRDNLTESVGDIGETLGNAVFGGGLQAMTEIETPGQIAQRAVRAMGQTFEDVVSNAGLPGSVAANLPQTRQNMLDSAAEFGQRARAGVEGVLNTEDVPQIKDNPIGNTFHQVGQFLDNIIPGAGQVREVLNEKAAEAGRNARQNVETFLNQEPSTMDSRTIEIQKRASELDMRPTEDKRKTWEQILADTRAEGDTRKTWDQVVADERANENRGMVTAGNDAESNWGNKLIPQVENAQNVVNRGQEVIKSMTDTNVTPPGQRAVDAVLNANNIKVEDFYIRRP